MNTSRGNIMFRPYVSVNGFYDSGLTGVAIDSNGRVPDDDAYGVEGEIGLTGYHTWKRTELGLDYRGDYRHYSRSARYYDGSDQILSLGISRRLSKRTQLTLREAAGTFSRNFVSLNPSGSLDATLLSVPDNEIFDNRVYFLLTQGDLTFQKSARLSFNVGGDGYLVRRRSTALYGVTGSSARGDVAYRYSRMTTVGADYRFSHFEFTKGFGGSDVHAVGLNYAVRLSRFWELALHLGGARVESLGLSRVQVDPVVAAITGQFLGIEAFHRVQYVPDLKARLARSFRRAQFQVNYLRGVNPGNGIYLTSAHQSADASYSYSGIHRWNIGVNAGYDRFMALLQTIGRYQAYHAGGGVTRQLKHNVHLMMRLDDRRYETGFGRFRRNTYRATLGFAYTPGDMPLSLW